MPNSFQILSVDTETTGVSSKDQVIQLAMLSLPNEISKIREAFAEHELRKLPMNMEYFCPNVPIQEGAFAVHKLTMEFLQKFRSAEEVELPKTCRIIIAHNAPFDYRMLGKPEGIKCICTIKLTKEIEKMRNESFGLENYQLGTVFKHFFPELYPKYIDNKHNAIVDTFMSTLVFVKVLEKFPFLKTVDEVYEFFFEKK